MKDIKKTWNNDFFFFFNANDHFNFLYRFHLTYHFKHFIYCFFVNLGQRSILDILVIHIYIYLIGCLFIIIFLKFDNIILKENNLSFHSKALERCLNGPKYLKKNIVKIDWVNHYTNINISINCRTHLFHKILKYRALSSPYTVLHTEGKKLKLKPKLSKPRETRKKNPKNQLRLLMMRSRVFLAYLTIYPLNHWIFDVGFYFNSFFFFFSMS